MARTGLINRTSIAASGAALAYLALAVPTALDRASADRPALASAVPAPFQRETLAGSARQLRDAGIPGSALDQAAALVRRDPLGPDSTGLLGVARLARGDMAGADAAFRVSARIGWREPATQVYWFQTALDRGDYSLAALRMSAVARQWPRAPAIDDMAARLQASPAGEAALVARLTSGEPWVSSFVLPGPNESMARLAARSDVLIAAARNGLRLGCNAVKDLTQTLVSGEPMRAAAIWRSHCRTPGDQALLSDGGLDQLSPTSRRTVFDWGLPGSGALESTVMTDAKGNRRVRAGNSSPVTAMVLEQSLVIPAGSYSLAWRSSASDVRAAGRVKAALSCSSESRLVRPAAGEWSAGTHRITLRFAGECPMPSVQLWLAPGSEAIEIDDLVLKAG